MDSRYACHGCGTPHNLMYSWGVLWCPDCVYNEARSRVGIDDERVWPEDDPYLPPASGPPLKPFSPRELERPEKSDFFDVNLINEGGLISADSARRIEAWVLA